MPSTKPRTAAPRVAVALLALLAVACGGSSPKSSTNGGGGQAAATKTPSGADYSPSGDIPDTQAYVRYAPPGAGFSVKVPEGWSRTTAGAAVSFTDKLNTVRLEETSSGAAPTVAGVTRTVVPQLARSQTGFKPGKVTTVRRTAGTAVRITYRAQGKADPVTGKVRQDAVERYLFFRNGREAVLTLSGPVGADNVDPWRTITDSLRWTR